MDTNVFNLVVWVTLPKIHQPMVINALPVELDVTPASTPLIVKNVMTSFTP